MKTNMNHQDFIDLASLYVLGALDARDNYLIEDCAESSQELRSELADLQIAALAIPYGSEQCNLPSGLKERLFQKLNSEHPTETPIMPLEIPSQLCSFQVKAREVNWLAHPDGVDGVSISPLFVDQISRRFSGFVRCDVGAIYPSHRHAEDEEILILEGDLLIDGKCFEVGDYIYSAPNSLHSAIGNRNGCLFFVRTSLDDRFM
jgi:hypothetical protein